MAVGSTGATYERRPSQGQEEGEKEWLIDERGKKYPLRRPRRDDFTGVGFYTVAGERQLPFFHTNPALRVSLWYPAGVGVA